MSENKTRKFSTHRLEINMSYPFPFIIGLLSLFIFVASISLLNQASGDLDIYLPIGWDNVAITEELTATIRSMTTRAAVVSILNSFYIVLLLVPLLVAFNFALSFGNGQIRTLVSYPIERKKLLLVKSGVIFVLMTVSVTLGSIVGLFFFCPFSIDVVVLCQLLGPLWITIFLMTVSCLFIAVLSRSASVTAAGGIGMWFGAFVVIPLPSTPSFIVNLLFPIFSAMKYVNPNPTSPFWYSGATSFNDVLYGCGAALALGALLLYFSTLVFRRLEV